ncbi:MAG: cadherin domain-containing protein [Sulfurimonas sp.]|nr:cadherin domain-containing protein [Sulfurimonas sp.]
MIIIKKQNYFSLTLLFLFATFFFIGCSSNDSSAKTLDIDIPPVITSSASVSIYENQVSALTITATDANGDTVTYSISGGDSESFSIDANSGEVTFNAAPDYETKTSYTFVLTATDEAGNTAIQNIFINIINIIEYTGYAPIITSSATVFVNENQISALIITATDANEETLTYSISEGDSEIFNINPLTGVVSFKIAPDYETKISYTFTATATDTSARTDTQNVTINIMDIYEGVPPVITSLATVSVNENQTNALTITATDIDGGAIIYFISGGDFANFSIDANSGIIAFNVAPDYETKTSYTFTATAIDNTAKIDTQSVTININDIAEVPILANSILFVDENATIGTEVGNITIADAGDTSITAFTLSDTTNFEVNASGYIKTKITLDYENNTTYTLTAYATNSGGDSTNVNIIININDIGDFYIRSAVYDNNATTSVTDDKLYIYFNQSINPVSIASDMSINYVLEGTGAIGTASASAYDDTKFHQHIISLNNAGSVSTALVVNDTNISIASDVLQDTSGNYTIYDANKTTVKKFITILKTGQIIAYIANDDGAYQSGKIRSYTDNGGTVTDNATGLIWQKEDDNVTRTWANAGTYCAGITLDGSSDFRLPTIQELIHLSDKKESNPSINPIFINTNSHIYWTSTTYAVTASHAWFVEFNTGFDFAFRKTNNYYVRCVR